MLEAGFIKYCLGTRGLVHAGELQGEAGPSTTRADLRPAAAVADPKNSAGLTTYHGVVLGSVVQSGSARSRS